ncbi:hypothetical protein CVT26_013328 [Gymnopilus dilepis]|uniref:Transmembrane protein n=1 Tax=Gymnopilus dilepis TaxID=231916 RepID=A0A409YEZ1_9AGAR|nr:hypothetical protein CVT26_013328 [Gymnopilus dilepis]
MKVPSVYPLLLLSTLLHFITTSAHGRTPSSRRCLILESENNFAERSSGISALGNNSNLVPDEWSTISAKPNPGNSNVVIVHIKHMKRPRNKVGSSTEEPQVKAEPPLADLTTSTIKSDSESLIDGDEMQSTLLEAANISWIGMLATTTLDITLLIFLSGVEEAYVLVCKLRGVPEYEVEEIRDTFYAAMEGLWQANESISQFVVPNVHPVVASCMLGWFGTPAVLLFLGNLIAWARGGGWFITLQSTVLTGSKLLTESVSAIIAAINLSGNSTESCSDPGCSTPQA